MSKLLVHDTTTNAWKRWTTTHAIIPVRLHEGKEQKGNDGHDEAGEGSKKAAGGDLKLPASPASPGVGRDLFKAKAKREKNEMRTTKKGPSSSNAQGTVVTLLRRHLEVKPIGY